MIKLSLITGRSRKDESKLTLSILLLKKWTMCDIIPANGETAVCIYNQQIIQRRWNNTPRACFVSRSHKLCKKIPCVRTPQTLLSLIFFHCKYYFICGNKDFKNNFVNMDHQKHLKSAPEVDLSVWAHNNNSHIRVSRLSSLLELILQKCKSRSNAVNNNHQVTTNVYA